MFSIFQTGPRPLTSKLLSDNKNKGNNNLATTIVVLMSILAAIDVFLNQVSIDLSLDISYLQLDNV